MPCEASLGLTSGDNHSPRLETREYDKPMGAQLCVRTNISFAIVGDDRICESLVHRLVLSPRCGLIKRFSLRSIRNGIVESGPENLESHG